jgi:DNA-binding NarL/FixJ family response regulator
MKTPPIRLLIAEDHKVVLQGYQQLLSSLEDIAIVATASNYYEVIRQLQVNACDVLLLDLSMPMTFHNNLTRLSGLDVLDLIKKEKFAVKSLVVSSHQDYQIIKKATALGAKGYIFKNADIDEIITAIRVVAKGQIYLQEEVEEILKTKKEDESRMTGEGVKLSPREREILRLLAEGLKSEEIADELGLVKYTIEEYRNNLIKKFKAKNAVHLVKIAYDYKFL